MNKMLLFAILLLVGLTFPGCVWHDGYSRGYDYGYRSGYDHDTSYSHPRREKRYDRGFSRSHSFPDRGRHDPGGHRSHSRPHSRR